MPIFVNCVCGKRLQGRDEDAGRQTRCPYCGKIITLPQTSDPEPQTNAPPDRSSLEPRERSEREYACRVCLRSFGRTEVYSEDGTYICKRCHERQEEDPEEPRGRWDHLEIPGRKRSARDRDDEDEIERPSRRRGRTRPVYPYLTEAILVTLFCCLPFGIVAIIKASEVNTCMARGDYYAAQAASESAKVWCGLSFGLGLAVFVIMLLSIATAG